MNQTSEQWCKRYKFNTGKIHDMYIKTIRKPNLHQPPNETRFHLVREMLDEFPLLRERIKSYLKVQMR